MHKKKVVSKKINKSRNHQSADRLFKSLCAEMAKHSNVEALNKNVIMPFIEAFEKVCGSRNYVLNIYGLRSNLVFTSEEDAEIIYQLIEHYLESKTSSLGKS
jgi:hypothetical protein